MTPNGTKKHAATSTIPETISSAQLEALSGLTERRLRQLADADKIPQPTGGRWKAVESVRALIAHYRTRTTPDEVEQAKLEKLQTETRLLALTEGERSKQLVSMAEVVEVVTRGLQAMTATVLAMTDLTIEHREQIINQLRECGDSVAGRVKNSDAPAAIHG